MEKMSRREGFADIRSKYGMIAVLVIVIVVFSLLNPNFMTLSNLSRILIGQVVIGCVGMAALFILIIDEFDMSLGYMLGFVLMVGGYLSGQGYGVGVVLPMMLAAGALAGLLNGFLTVICKITSAIATLGVGILLYGLTLAMSNGQVLSLGIPKEMVAFSQGRLFDIPYPVYVFFIVAAVLVFVLTTTPFGKRLYAIGGNERAAFLSGIKTKKLRILTFMISGLCVAFGAVILLGQAQAANPSRGPEYLMSAYATVYLSVTAFRPGAFNMQGMILSLFLLGIGFNGVSLLGAPFWFESVFYGIILICAVLFASKEARAAKAG